MVAAWAVTTEDEISIVIAKKHDIMEQKRFIISPLEEYMTTKIIAIAAAGIIGFFAGNWNEHYIATKDTSIQGYIEYLKEKYYYKKKD